MAGRRDDQLGDCAGPSPHRDARNRGQGQSQEMSAERTEGALYFGLEWSDFHLDTAIQLVSLATLQREGPTGEETMSEHMATEDRITCLEP